MNEVSLPEAPIWVNRGYPVIFTMDEIAKIEITKNATYVGDFCILTKTGRWSEHAVSIFYVERPEKPEYSNYFGLFYQGFGIETLYITNGISVTEGSFEGVVTPSGEVIFSRWRHDFRKAETADISVDGGRDYLRIVGDRENVSYVAADITIKDGKFFVSGQEAPCWPIVPRLP